MFESFIALVVPALIPGAGALVTGLVSLALVGLKKYVATKTNNELVENALTRISNTTETVVASLTQTVVASLKEASADGTLTAEDAASVKAQAMEAIMAQIPAAIQQNASLGITDLETFVSSKIEAAVATQKTGILEAVTSAVSGD